MRQCDSSPITTRTYNSRGVFFMDQGQYERAIADLTEAIRLNPRDPLPYRNRAHCLYQERRCSESSEADRAIAQATRLKYKQELTAATNRGLAATPS